MSIAFRYNLLIFCLTFWFALNACKKTSTPEPFGQNQPTIVYTPDSVPPPEPESFAGLHYYIFKPTCANSGCHDGTFEPDFRTIESSYNTLVLHPVIKNNPQNSFQYRVKPGDPNASILITRLTIDIDGQSGIMPLITDSGNNWNQEKALHIQRITNWISSGAKDALGNTPPAVNGQPWLAGFSVLPLGQNTPYPTNVNGTFIIPSGTSSVDVWFSFKDDNTNSNQLEYNKVKYSNNPYNFLGSTEFNLITSSNLSLPGFDGTTVLYTHKSTYTFNGQSDTSAIFARGYVKDPQLSIVTEIPSSGSLEHILNYCSFKRTN